MNEEGQYGSTGLTAASMLPVRPQGGEKRRKCGASSGRLSLIPGVVGLAGIADVIRIAGFLVK